MTAPRVLWRRMSRGLLLAGFGVFLLLTTTGFLPRFFWLNALRFWPVLLIGLGVRLVFERSRAPWAILLSPLLILGTMTWVAAATPEPWTGSWDTVRVDRPDTAGKWRLRGRMVFASVDLAARPLEESLLVTGRTAGMGPGVVTSRDWSRGMTVDLDGDVHGWIWPDAGARSRRWELELSDRDPVSLDFDVAFARGTLDFESATVPDVGLDGAFNDLTLRLGTPESPSRIDLDGAFNRIELVVPPGTPISVRTDGLLNLVRGRERRGRTAGPGWILNVEGAFNRIVVRYDAAGRPM